MTRWSKRALLILLFIGVGIVLLEKDSTSLKAQTRVSRRREKNPPQVVFPHVGSLSDFKLKPQQYERTSALSWLNFDKKINTYYFTFYNWYYFEISFVDLTYESYIEFKVFMEDQLHDRWIHKTGFTLD